MPNMTKKYSVNSSSSMGDSAKERKSNYRAKKDAAVARKKRMDTMKKQGRNRSMKVSNSVITPKSTKGLGGSY